MTRAAFAAGQCFGFFPHTCGRWDPPERLQTITTSPPGSKGVVAQGEGRPRIFCIDSIKSLQGVKLDLNINIYDMTPLLRAIEFRNATGYWPVRPAAAPQGIVG